MQAFKQKFPEAKILLNVSNHRLNRAFSKAINIFGLFFLHLVSHLQPFTKVERHVFFLLEFITIVRRDSPAIFSGVFSFETKSFSIYNQLIFLTVILLRLCS